MMAKITMQLTFITEKDLHNVEQSSAMQTPNSFSASQDTW